jgi:hypothetical protein
MTFFLPMLYFCLVSFSCQIIVKEQLSVNQTGLRQPSWTTSTKLDYVNQTGLRQPNWTTSTKLDYVNQTGLRQSNWTTSTKLDYVNQTGLRQPNWGHLHPKLDVVHLTGRSFILSLGRNNCPCECRG